MKSNAGDRSILSIKGSCLPILFSTKQFPLHTHSLPH